MGGVRRTADLAVFGLIGLVLAGLIGAQGWRAVKPSIASDFEKTSVQAMEAGKAPSDLAALSRKIADRDPLDVRGYVMLGLLADKMGQGDQAKRLMAAAAQLNKRDDVADAWLFTELMRRGEFDQGLLHADALLRRREGRSDEIIPGILGSIRSPDALQALGRRLATTPPWRANFIENAFRRLANPAGGALMLGAIAQNGGTVRPGELAPVLHALVANKEYEQAYLNWVLYSPSKLVYNALYIVDGDFNTVASAPPFNWSKQTGHFSFQDASAYGRREPALRINYDGLGPSQVLGEQLIVLPPGQYQFTGDTLVGNAVSANSVAWTLTCVNGEAPLAAVAADSPRNNWRSFKADLTVGENCPAQWLRVVTKPIGTMASVDVWFDKLAINRMEPGA